MRILFVTNRFPGLERRGDQLRAFQHITLLAQRHRITVLSFESAPPSSLAYRQLAACCEKLVMVTRARAGMWWRAALALPGRLPLQVAMYNHVPASLQLDRLLHEGDFDLAHVQLARLGPLLTRLAPLPCVLDLVDALSLNMARRAQIDHAPLRWLAQLEAARLSRYERELCAQARLSTICAAPDRASIGAPPRLRLLHNGVDLEQFSYRQAGGRGHSLVFVGNLGYFPNIDGITWFVRAVLPLLLAEFPDLRLRLVGVRPATALRRLSQRHVQVDLIGAVADVLPWLHQAAVAIAPLRAGSGQQLKILEAMAAGTPVVASATSAAGLQAIAGHHLHIAADAPAMAAAITALWRNEAAARQMAAQAHAWVAADYSWAASAAQLERIWEEATHPDAG